MRRRLVLLVLAALLLAGCTGARDEPSAEGDGGETAILWDAGSGFRIAPAPEAAAYAVLVHEATGATLANVTRADWNASDEGGFRVATPPLGEGAHEVRVHAADGRALATRAFDVRSGDFASLAPTTGPAMHAFRLTLNEERGTRESLQVEVIGNLTAARDGGASTLRAEGAGRAEGTRDGFRFEGSIPRFDYATVDGAPETASLVLDGTWETQGNAPPAEGTLRAATDLLRLEACPEHASLACRLTLERVSLDGTLAAGGLTARVESYNATHRWTVAETGNPVRAEWEQWTNRTAYGQTERDHDTGEATWSRDAPPTDGETRLDAAFDLFGAWPARALHPWPLQPGDRLEASLGNATWLWLVEPDTRTEADGREVRVIGASGGARALVHVALDGEREGVATVATLQEERAGAWSRLTMALDPASLR